MTREEAKSELMQIYMSLSEEKKQALDVLMAQADGEYDDAKYHEEHGEVVVDKAVWEDAKRALEQELCEDAISREELLKAIDTWDKFGCDADTKLVPYQDHYIPYIHYDDIIKCIKGMPSVAIPSAEPKTGHWIEVTNGRGGHQCDNCGEYAPSYQNGDEYLSKFCPKCGQKKDFTTLD